MTYYLFLIIIAKTKKLILIINFCKENLIYNKLQCSKFYKKKISNNYKLFKSEFVFN